MIMPYASGELISIAEGKSEALQIALCHLFFNLSGILIFYPVPFLRWPLTICKILGRTTARYRWFAIFYLLMMFFLLPGFVMALSLAGNTALLVVLIPIIIALTAVIVINVIQAKKPEWLPSKLKNWSFVPFWMHSLEPIDKALRKIGSTCCACCGDECDCLSVKPETNEDGKESEQKQGQTNVAFESEGEVGEDGKESKATKGEINPAFESEAHN